MDRVTTKVFNIKYNLNMYANHSLRDDPASAFMLVSRVLVGCLGLFLV